MPQTDRFDSLSELFDEAIIIVDRTGVVEHSNAKAFELLGAHIANRPLDNFLRHPDFQDALDAASAIGKRLLDLSRHEQVLVVTHSPQVASYADNHLKVEKINDNNSTVIKVDTLDEEMIIREIARMLSGELITSEALAAAATLRKASKGTS